jgi:hypothetical protein
MNSLIKLAVLTVIAYTGAQALNSSIDKIELNRNKAQESTNQIKGM